MNNRYIKLLYLFLLTSLSSCQAIEEVVENENVHEGKFLTTYYGDYSVEMTRSQNATPKTYTSSDGEMMAYINEAAWDSPLTRSNVTGEEVEWSKAYPDMALYATDANQNPIVLDLPMNPYSHEVYEYLQCDLTFGPKNGVVSNTPQLWDETLLNGHLASNISSLPQEENFYGYYPRPRDIRRSEGSAYLYDRNSIIEVNDARNTGTGWNVLSYSFYDNQREDNQSFFDVMCSISEEDNVAADGRYGNQKKKSGDNIQMAFEHIFCLLNITVNKSEEYTNACNLSSLSISGTQVFKSGTLDILTGKTTPKDGGSIIYRDFAAQDILEGKPFNTTLIVQPTIDNPISSSKERLVINCTIDGTKYSCDLADLKLERGKKYNINLTVKPSGMVTICAWKGATVFVGDTEYESGKEHKINISSNTKYFTVKTDDNIRVFNNGVEVQKEESGYPMEKDKTYNVITYPKENWYHTDALRIHYDGIWNNKYEGQIQQTSNMGWSDISGHDNDGLLQGFNSTEDSGWTTGKGLSFDGDDDIVTFPGNINNGDYTIEMYVYLPSTQKKSYPRLIAEGIKYACYCLNSTTKYRISIYGNNVLNHGLNPDVIPLDKMCQIDFIYTKASHEIKVLMTYWDEATEKLHQTSATDSSESILPAASIPTASLGGRIADTARSLVGTYYSFLMYDRVLSETEIKENFEVNKSRFGVGTSRK